jgi:hypothetical protein
MITIWSAMRPSLGKALIIGLLALLSGCSALRLGYENGPTVAWWWLDGYVDFSTEQTPLAKDTLRQWFAWHRPSQLPELAALLASAQPVAAASITPAQACQWLDRARAAVDPSIERAYLMGAELVPGLGEAQFRHLEQRFAKVIAEMRGDYLQPRPDDRLKASVKRAVDRAESFYGRLDASQRKLVAAGVVASPFDPEAWLEERKRRQADMVQTLRRLVGEKADRDRIVAAMRVQAERIERSPDPGYRAYQQRLRDYNCAAVAQLHGVATADQRRTLQDKLKGWEDDLRALMAAQP